MPYSHSIFLYRMSEPCVFILEVLCWVQGPETWRTPSTMSCTCVDFFIQFKVQRSSRWRITTRKQIPWLLILNSIHVTLLPLWMVLGGPWFSRTDKCLKQGPLHVGQSPWKAMMWLSSLKFPLKWEWRLCLPKMNLFQPTFIKFRIWWAVSFESLH